MRAAIWITAMILLTGSALAFGILVGPLTSDQVVQDPSFYNTLGYKLAQDGKNVEAQAAFAKAVSLDPNYENARSNLATIAFNNGDYATAIENLRVLVEGSPTNSNYKFDLAQNLVHQARFVDGDLAKLNEAAGIFESLGSYPHAAENAAIVRNVVAEVS